MLAFQIYDLALLAEIIALDSSIRREPNSDGSTSLWCSMYDLHVMKRHIPGLQIIIRISH
jgi:hypothetical protein